MGNASKKESSEVFIKKSRIIVDMKCIVSQNYCKHNVIIDGKEHLLWRNEVFHLLRNNDMMIDNHFKECINKDQYLVTQLILQGYKIKEIDDCNSDSSNPCRHLVTLTSLDDDVIKRILNGNTIKLLLDHYKDIIPEHFNIIKN